jgi:hypothetical protein
MERFMNTRTTIIFLGTVFLIALGMVFDLFSEEKRINGHKVNEVYFPDLRTANDLKYYYTVLSYLNQAYAPCYFIPLPTNRFQSVIDYRDYMILFDSLVKDHRLIPIPREERDHKWGDSEFESWYFRNGGVPILP